VLTANDPCRKKKNTKRERCKSQLVGWLVRHACSCVRKVLIPFTIPQEQYLLTTGAPQITVFGYASRGTVSLYHNPFLTE
jgi:hypothetical protein